jgi:flagellar biosynthesis regulator FlbT
MNDTIIVAIITAISGVLIAIFSSYELAIKTVGDKFDDKFEKYREEHIKFLTEARVMLDRGEIQRKCLEEIRMEALKEMEEQRRRESRLLKIYEVIDGAVKFGRLNAVGDEVKNE